MFDHQIISMLAQRLGVTLAAGNLTLVTAESCTGGWIAKAITDVPGSSRWFDCGFVTYSNASKVQLLGVHSATLQTYGAVSEATAREMTAGALANSRADCAVVTTGIAGPDGATADKPVGTVWIGWQARGAEPRAARYQYQGDREQVRAAAVADALRGLLAWYA